MGLDEKSIEYKRVAEGIINIFKKKFEEVAKLNQMELESIRVEFMETKAERKRRSSGTTAFVEAEFSAEKNKEDVIFSESDISEKLKNDVLQASIKAIAESDGNFIDKNITPVVKTKAQIIDNLNGDSFDEKSEDDENERDDDDEDGHEGVDKTDDDGEDKEDDEGEKKYQDDNDDDKADHEKKYFSSCEMLVVDGSHPFIWENWLNGIYKLREENGKKLWLGPLPRNPADQRVFSLSEDGYWTLGNSAREQTIYLQVEKTIDCPGHEHKNWSFKNTADEFIEIEKEELDVDVS